MFRRLLLAPWKQTQSVPPPLRSRRQNTFLRYQWLDTHQPVRSYTTLKARNPTDTSATMMSKSDQAPVLIIGAGVAGLSLAAILQQNSIPYLVFESSPPTRMQRHGITLYPWAYLPLCQALGIKPERLRSAVATDSAIGGMGTVDLMMRDIHAGGSLQHKLETSIPEPHEVTESFRANKSAMREFFMERIDTTKLFWEWKLKSIGNDDGCIAAEFEGREATKGRLLVAADGLQSVGIIVIVCVTSTNNRANL